jgi:isoleucyl-tRNA synthetase
MDYKQTLNLPQTDFSMKANLAQREPLVLAEWEAQDLYSKMRQARAGKPQFILHDGPPYANGRIHIGHALNKILKDIIVRYKFLRGFDAPYIPGWDCHGLPVEHQLFKDLKKNKDQIDRVAFRKLACDYAMKYVAVQREEFKRLGLIGDWSHPYLTLDKKYERGILESFAALIEKGFVYRGLKPVNWCSRCETALAEAEVEYADHESDSIFVKFEIKPGDRPQALKFPDEKNYLLIWTTTPWTLVANVAVAVHPDLEYVLVAAQNGNLVMARALFEAALREPLSLLDAKVLAHFKGRDLEGLSYAHPFIRREGKVVLADYVSHEEGSGCVHTAPGHGQEDFMTGLKYRLDVLMPVDERGRFDATAGVFSGMHVFEANPKILEVLRGSGHLALAQKFTHAYPHCWRCKNPIIFRATHQWFLKIDHDNLRQALLRSIQDDVTWIPSSGRGRIASMVSTRPDWCLSRQRYWGVPIPAVICTKCRQHILDARIARALAARAAEEGTDIWFTADLKEFLPWGFRCFSGCPGDDFERSMDILDVWFDSGVSHQAVLKGVKGLKLPADLYLEGSDQHRGWFQASLISSMAIDGKPPFESVLTHGFVVDGEGRKMSKSMGNVVAPQDVMKEFGADILRLWVMSSDYNEDVRISKGLLAFVSDAYRKIRNTVRFLLSNLYDFDPEKDALSGDHMLEIDRWALARLKVLRDDVTSGYEHYAFYLVFQRLFSFCNEEMSALYLDILKDRLYTSGRASVERRSAQTALHEICFCLVRMLAPVIPFTAEEIFRSMKKKVSGDAKSVHLSDWPEIPASLAVRLQDVAHMDALLGFRPAVLKALEEQRAKGVIGSSLEASLKLTIKDKLVHENFSRHADQLKSLFIVSEVALAFDERSLEPLGILVAKASGKKCERCWNYALDVDVDALYPGVCGRCVKAIKS